MTNFINSETIIQWIQNQYHGFKISGISLIATYSNSSCNRRAQVDTKGLPSSAHFPNEENCGPRVTVTATLDNETNDYSCHATSRFNLLKSGGFPNLQVIPVRLGSNLPGCTLTDGKELSNQNLQLPTTTIYVDSWDAFAAGSIFWQNEDCPTQQFFIKGSEIIQPLPYYDYCGNFTITAQSLSPLPQADCAVESNEYPTPYYNTRIPNWKISKTRYGCTIDNVDFLEFYVFVGGWKKSASVFVDWKNCPSQTLRVWGNSPFPPSFQYGPYCDDYIVIANIDGVTCSWGSSRYPIPNLKADSNNGTYTMDKVVSV